MTALESILRPPPDLPALISVILAALLLAGGRRTLTPLFRASRPVVLGCLAGGAAALSAGYIVYYLRGGPRVIDATSYWLQARALAEGWLSWPVTEPSASIRGRFLLAQGPLGNEHVGVIFPPGYPAFLAIGFWLAHPLWMGPLTAAGLVLATYALARAVTKREEAARLAGCLSMLCAALRYHTADTMSHGFAALLLTSALALLYVARDALGSLRQGALFGAGAGFAVGWLVATRPVTALGLAPALAFVTWPLPWPTKWAFVASALPPLAFLVLEQRVVTGAFFSSSQSLYYSLADGPPGCFRYGFGAGIGCLHEHGEYVAAVLPTGLTWKAAAITTLRRLHIHFIDVANADPLMLLVAGAPWLALRSRDDSKTAGRVLTLACAVVLVILAYVPFYFDGSYPGGGARFFADVIPLEHVLLAFAVAQLTSHARVGPTAKRAGWSKLAGIDFATAARWVVVVTIGGFGLRAAFDHVSLRERDGGRPFYEPSVVARAGVSRGLLFVGTDHAFNLAYDPQATDARTTLATARAYGDDRDRLVWERYDRPPAFYYAFEGRRDQEPTIVPWSPPPPTHSFRFEAHSFRFEAEAEWPPLEQSGGYFEPVFATATCASGGRLLAIRSLGTGSAERPFHGLIAVPLPDPGLYTARLYVTSRGDVTARVAWLSSEGPPREANWHSPANGDELTCSMLPDVLIKVGAKARLEVKSWGPGELGIDAVELETEGYEPGARAIP